MLPGVLRGVFLSNRRAKRAVRARASTERRREPSCGCYTAPGTCPMVHACSELRLWTATQLRRVVAKCVVVCMQCYAMLCMLLWFSVLYEGYVWVPPGNAMKAKQRKCVSLCRRRCVRSSGASSTSLRFVFGSATRGRWELLLVGDSVITQRLCFRCVFHQPLSGDVWPT